MEDYEGNEVYAKYSLFSVAAGYNYYKLALGSYSGTAADVSYT